MEKLLKDAKVASYETMFLDLMYEGYEQEEAENILEQILKQFKKLEGSIYITTEKIANRLNKEYGIVFCPVSVL